MITILPLRRSFRRSLAVFAGFLIGVPIAAMGSTQEMPSSGSQEVQAAPARTLRLNLTEVTLSVGDTAQLVAEVVNADGEVVEAELGYFSRNRRSVSVGRSDGMLTAIKPGTFQIIIRERLKEAAATQEGRAKPQERLSGVVKVTVLARPLERLELSAPDHGLYVGTVAAFGVRGIDDEGEVREGLSVAWTSSDPAVAS